MNRIHHLIAIALMGTPLLKGVRRLSNTLTRLGDKALGYLRKSMNDHSRPSRMPNDFVRRSRFERLEERALLATFSGSGSTLSISLNTPNESIGIVAGVSTVTLTNTGGGWNGINNPAVQGNGTNVLTITSPLTYTTVNIFDAAANTSVNFNNSGSNTYNQFFNVQMLNATAGSIAFNGNTTFSAVNSLNALTTGNVTVNSTALLKSVTGSLSLGTTGANKVLAVNGGMQSNGGSISLRSAGNVNVATNQVLNAGTGSVELSADVTLGSTGDNGIGTLTIGSGASLIGRSVVLRGADIEVASTASVQASGNFQSVSIQSSVNNRPMSLGGTNTAVNGVNLTDAELTRIVTAFDGSIVFGSSSQTGDISLVTASPATTAGASIQVRQSPSFSGKIILDDGAGTATALHGNGGQISLFAGTGGVTSLASNNSAAELSTSGNTISINTTGPVGSSTNRIQIADNQNSNQQRMIIGDNDAGQPSSVFLDGLGSLSLGSIVGTISNPIIDITARTHLSAIGTISSGSKPLILAADATATGAGHDGTGTLTVNAGSVLYGQAVYLSGADQSIDASATIEAAGNASSNPTATLTGLNNARNMIVDSSGNLYVANIAANTVSKFAPGSTTPSATLTGLNGPFGLVFDSSGNLYVSNYGSSGNGSTISKFAPGATTPIATLSLGGGGERPTNMAFDSSGNLYVANQGSSNVARFSPGATSPNAFLTGVSGPIDLAFDNSGNLFVANEQSHSISRFAPGATSPFDVISGGLLSSPRSLLFDASGNLYVANSGNGTVSKYSPGYTAYTGLNGLLFPYDLTMDTVGNLYVADTSTTVKKFAPGATRPSVELNIPGTFLTLDSASNLYVNRAGNIVSKFIPSSADTAVLSVESSVVSRPMSLGGSNGAVNGINLSDVELSRMLTAPNGRVQFGDSNQIGDISIETAKLATTPGTSIYVQQSQGSAGKIILDNGQGASPAINANGGFLSLTSGSSSIIGATTNLSSTMDISDAVRGLYLLSSGDLGSTLRPLQLGATTLIADTARNNRNQYLASVGTIPMVVQDMNANTGTVTLAGGVFNFGNTSILAGNFNINASSTLSGSGTVLGSVTVNQGGTINPGSINGIGNLTVGSIAFNGGTFAADFSGNASDTITASMGANLSDPMPGIFAINSASGTPSGTPFTLINNLGRASIVNAPLSNAGDGNAVVVNGTTTRAHYFGDFNNDGFNNDFVLYPILAAPTNIALSATSITENNSVNAIVGNLSSIDSDLGDVFTYSLVPGIGDADNTAFAIDTFRLRANLPFNYEAKNAYSIRIRTTDLSGRSFETALTINITDVDETPPKVVATNFQASGTVPTNSNSLTVTFNEPILGANLPSSYQLRRAGSDGLLLVGDTATEPDSVSISGTAVTLHFAIPLVEDIYRLTVKDSITDAFGNLLDGDGDGTSGGDWRMDFVTLDAAQSFQSGSRILFDVDSAMHGSGQLVQGSDNAFDGLNRILVDGYDYIPPLAAIAPVGPGTLTFQDASVVSSNFSGLEAIKTDDLNNDGFADIATVSNTAHAVHVLINNRNGGYTTSSYSSGGSSPISLKIADFNNDGNADIVVANRGSSDLRVLLGNGNGGFAGGAMIASGGVSPYVIEVGDFNGDGNQDIITANLSSNTVHLLLGNGSGGFTTGNTVSSGGTSPFGLAVGNFNADLLQDVVVSNSSGTLQVLLGSSNGTLSVGSNFSSGGTNSRGVVAGDFNRDGIDDVAVANMGNNSVRVFLAIGSGGFSTGTSIATGDTNPRALAVGNFDTDGNLDLAVSHISGNDRVSILLGTGTGTFTTGLLLPTGGASTDSDLESVAVADLDNNGRDDVVVTGFGSGTVYQLMNRTSSASVVTPVQSLSGLNVHREIFVPTSGLENFARTIDVFRNSTTSSVPTSVTIVGNLGSDAATTVFATSDGDLIVEPTDLWFGTDDMDGFGTPAIIHLMHGPSGLQPTSVNVLEDNVQWTYEMSVPAASTNSLAHFTVLGTTRQQAIDAASALINLQGFDNQAALHLTDFERTTLANFQFNYAPTNIAISNTIITENAGSNATIGSLTFADPNVNESGLFSLPFGLGDNASFNIGPDGVTLRANESLNFELKNSYNVILRITDAGGLFFDKQFNILVENALEQTSPVQIGDGTAQRSIVKQLVVSFDQAIEFSAGAFQVYQRISDANGPRQLVPVTTLVALTPTASGMLATLTFAGALTRAGTNALVDGNYELAIDGSLIRIANTPKLFDADGDGVGGGFYQLGTRRTDDFFALLGDANGNGEVDAQDLLGAKLGLRKTIGQAGYNFLYDINGNGVIDAQDILNIQNNLRKRRALFQPPLA